METIRDFTRAWIQASENGVEISEAGGYMGSKHYDVKIVRHNGFYVITGSKATFDLFINIEHNEEIVNSVIEEHVSIDKSSWLNFFNPKKYVKGYCEFKKRLRMSYTTTNITIIEKL